jgi:VCBS repeat-containing protein
VATVSLTINPVNDAPSCANVSLTTDEDTVGSTAPSCSDVDGDELTYSIVAQPAHGSAAVVAGELEYTPDANYHGSDSFTYRASDGTLDSNVANVAVTVNSVNDAPVAGDDAYSTAEDTLLNVPAPGVLADDGDVEGDSLSAVLVSGPSHGSLTLNADGSFTYTPGANYNGSDSFTYKADDGPADSNVATVTITVTPVNDAPVAVGDSYDTDEDTQLNLAAPGVLGNDEDVDGDTLTAVLVSGPSHGTLTLNANGGFTYTPAANYHGPDSFTYRASDGSLSSNTATVSLTVRSVNDAPVVSAGNDVSGAEGSAITLDGTASDVEDPMLTTQWTYTAGAGVDSGATCSFGSASSVDTTITCTDDGTYTATLTATDDDGASTSDTTTVTVSNVPPTLTSLTPSSYLVLKGTSVSVTGQYTDPASNDTFTCVVNWDEPTGTPESVVGGPTSCSPSHTYTAQGTYTVSLKVRDDDGGESNTLVTIITVYDPGAGGFVSGGGWITSPVGSYAAAPTLSGKANFGFTSQYKKGASTPTGETEFQLHFASFNFHSTAYEVLVVSGYKAQFRGTGTVNGESGYKFVLTAFDGQLQGDGVDKFRIKISRISDGVVVYDTKMGVSEDMDLAAPLAIGGGSIVIHKPK